MSKPSIVFDVDGVLFNFAKGFANWFNQHEDFEISDNPSSYSWHSPDEDRNKLIMKRLGEFVRSDEQEFELMSSNVPEIVSELRKKYRVVLVTGYPNREMRIKHLAQHGIEYDELHFTDRNKAEYIQKHNINPVFCVEDDPVIVLSYARAGWNTYVPAYWNYTETLTQQDHAILYFNISELLRQDKLELLGKSIVYENIGGFFGKQFR